MSEGRRGHVKRAGIAALLGAAALVLASTAVPAQETTTTTSTTTTTEPPITVAVAPTFTKDFLDDPIASGGTSTLQFEIDNFPNPMTALTSLSFTDDLPSGLEVAPTPGLNNTCAGMWTPGAGDTQLVYSGGTVAAGATCVVEVEITATAGGSYTNDPVTLTSSQPNAASPAATLAVMGFTASFSPDTIDPNGVSTLTFEFDNPGPQVTGVAFNDTLPTSPGAMVVASTPNASTTCGGSFTGLAAGDATLNFTGGTVPANGTCQVQVDVTAPTAGTYENDATLTASSIGTGATQTASLAVTPLVVTKTFVEGSIPSGGTATFNISIRNDGTEPLSNVQAVDPLVPACDRPFPTLAVNESQTYTCTLANVTTGFTNTVTVTGTGDPSGVAVRAEATAVVTVAAAAVPAAAAGGPALAVTGSATGPLTGIGLGIVALGSLLVFSSSNRRRLFRRT